MEDQLAILHGLWGEPDGWSFDGHQVRSATRIVPSEAGRRPGRPRTPNGGARPRLLVGGEGSPRAYRLAARYADEFNLSSSAPDAGAGGVRRSSTPHVVAIGRDPAHDAFGDGRRLIGRNEAEMAARLTPAARRSAGKSGDGDLARERREPLDHRHPGRSACDGPAYAEAGVERIKLQDLLPWDLDNIDVMGEVLVGQV